MLVARARRAILLGAFATLSVELTMMGCSSDKPAATTNATDGSSAGDAVPSNDAALVDGDAAGDAAVDQLVNGPCWDDKPAPIDASATPGCPSSATCSAICEHVVDHYKLGVAQVAIACLVALPSCSTQSDVYACVDKALGNACADPAAPAYCTSIVKACDPNAGGLGSSIDQQGCVTFANGFSAAGRSTFAGCLQSKIEAGTCPTEVVTCADEIRR